MPVCQAGGLGVIGGRGQTAEQTHPDQHENARAEQAMEAHQQAARFAALGHEALDFDAGVDADEQRQHQPVQRD
jgi:hypothetical protein